MKTTAKMLIHSQGHFDDYEVRHCCVYAEPEVAEAELAEVRAEVERVRSALAIYDDDGFPTVNAFDVRDDGVAVVTFYGANDDGSDAVKTAPTSLHTFGVRSTVADDASFTLVDVVFHP